MARRAPTTDSSGADVKHTLHLGDHLDTAHVSMPGPDHVDLRYLTVAKEERLSLFQHPSSTVRVELPDSFEGGRLCTACGIASRSWSRVRGAVRFRVGVVDDGSDVRWLHELSLDPRRSKADRRWIPVDIEVPAATHLVLETTARHLAHARAGWDDPVLVWETATVTPRRSRRSQPNVLLITSEACRPTFASPPVPTADVLAVEGIRCTGARTVTPLGPPSSASLFTGRYPFRHGMLTDWGALPAHFPNLATELARAGYHTAFAPSRQYMGRPEHGFVRAFSEVVPCLTNPNQPGEVTTRRVLQWLDNVSDDRPWFLWVTYYDAHPPFRLPPAVVRRFYDADPRDSSRSYRPEAVRAIHHVESLLAIDAVLPALRQGVIDPQFVRRLHNTACALDGTAESGPDLAVLLGSMSPSVRRGLSARKFSGWLHEHVRILQSGRIDPDLLKWLEHDLVPALEEVDQESLGWLADVVDYRYPVALAQAGAAHVDDQIEELAGWLRAAGLYDDCTVLYCASYVEMFGEHDHVSHHLSLSDGILQVPFVLKPACGIDAPTPAVVDGPFELVDVLPTLLESLGLLPPTVDGTSRWEEFRTGKVTEHDTFAVGPFGAEVAITSGRHKLLKSLADEGGSSTLFELCAEEEAASSDVAIHEDLAKRLDAWLATNVGA